MKSPPSTELAAMAEQGRRYCWAGGIVAFWIMLGFGLKLDPNGYLLLGVPLLLIFQRGVAKRPIGELWFRGAGSDGSGPGGDVDVASTWWAWPVALVFMAWPVERLIHGGVTQPWSQRLWLVCAVIGAAPLAFSLPRWQPRATRALGLCFATAGLFAVILLVVMRLGAGWPRFRAGDGALLIGVRSFFLYLPGCFLLEEVFFRGGLDSYVHRPGDRTPWISAVFVSCLWGWWHLPILLQTVHVHGGRLVAAVLLLVIGLPLLHCVYGVPYSLAWRKSGLLLVPAIVHAFADALRNALQSLS